MDPNADLIEKLTCPVCIDVPRRGGFFTCANDHLICRGCYHHLDRDQKICPMCREPFLRDSKGELYRTRVLDSLLDTVLLPCQFQEKGCSVQKTRRDLSRHEDRCEFRSLSCPNEGCEFQGDSDKIQRHRDECPFRNVDCRYASAGCVAVLPEREADSHTADCVFQPVRCPYNNSVEMPLCDLPGHLAQEHLAPVRERNKTWAWLNQGNDMGTASFAVNNVISCFGHRFHLLVRPVGDDHVQANVMHLDLPSRSSDFVATITAKKPHSSNEVLASFRGPCAPADRELSTGLLLSRATPVELDVVVDRNQEELAAGSDLLQALRELRDENGRLRRDLARRRYSDLPGGSRVRQREDMIFMNYSGSRRY